MLKKRSRTSAILSCIAIAIVLPGSLAHGGFTTIVDNGPSDNRVDIVFMGDGYTASDIAAGTYTTHINAMLNHMFNDNEDPFPRYANFFNVHRIDVVSNESGADIPPDGVYVDTALDASYYWDGVTERLLYVDHSTAVGVLNTELAGAGFNAEMRLVTVNHTKYGGGGGYFAVYAGGHASAPEIALHELGHSFGDLADEYWYAGTTYTGPEPSRVNITTNSDPGTCKWSQWIGYNDPAHPEMGAIGVYEGAGYYQYGLYRPSQNSKMRSLNQPFDAVGREQLILSIYDYVDPLDDWLDNSSTLVDPASLWVDVVDADVIDLQWYVDSSLVGGATGETFSLAGYAPGEYEVAAFAYDNAISDWIRRDLDDAQMWVTWTVQVSQVIPAPGAMLLGMIGAALVGLTRVRRRKL